MHRIINTPITQFKQEPNKCHSAIMYFAAYFPSVHRGRGGKVLIALRNHQGVHRENKNCNIIY